MKFRIKTRLKVQFESLLSGKCSDVSSIKSALALSRYVLLQAKTLRIVATRRQVSRSRALDSLYRNDNFPEIRQLRDRAMRSRGRDFFSPRKSEMRRDERTIRLLEAEEVNGCAEYEREGFPTKYPREFARLGAP